MSKNLKLFIILFLIFISSFTLTFYFYNPLNLDTQNLLSPDVFNPLGPSKEVPFSIVTLGSTDYGSVTREGPYGNSSSSQKIAIIVGVHPQESQAHKAFIDSLKEHNNTLQSCYYVYKVNVTRDAGDYEKGRSNGQKLANQYVVPDIKKQNFDLVVDVHSNRGNYERRRFVSVPAGSTTAENVASQLVQKLNWLSIYDPPNPTSPAYVTIPLIKSGIPAIIYETYGYEPYNQSKKQADQFITVLDQIEIK
ncbi:hypothetical protein FGU46_10280 [Methanobacterium sp. CWC-01]|uniref:hypothetical protein n=1 Tax=Methanobacterium aridiramus TaxID=2584467 RepID=UPI00257842B2|nr:hypothetical protein [Methanobacterium sp. CWC-01]WJI10446.1 hypothetical protein FGU46_10280 [Methanobacterium sp. CWC-01]